jgi:Mrp family chromosome partitioning ATPase
MPPRGNEAKSWGELDFSIVDSPPGKGDLPRELFEIFPQPWAVVVV